MKLPKIRELAEAVRAVFSPRFTTRFPAEPCEVPEKYRGKPEFDEQACTGCGACVNVCPTNALTMEDDLEASPPVRRITLRYDACIFCGNCVENCTTTDGIRLSKQWDLATLDRNATIEIVWVYEKLGPLAYTNPSLLLAKDSELFGQIASAGKQKATDKEVRTGDFMRILCPKCKCELNIKL